MALKKPNQAHPVRVGSIYQKPLLPKLNAEMLESGKALKKAKSAVLKAIKRGILQTTFSKRAKIALTKCVKVEIKQSSLVITARHPAWKPLIEGQKAGQMTWLKKAKAPIPIVTESGEVIFRSATPKSFEDGKWVHPGRQPSNLVEKARREARTAVKATLAREVKRQLKASFGWKK